MPASYLTSYGIERQSGIWGFIPAGSGTIRTCGSWICLTRQNMRQLDLFDTNDYEKLEKMDETIDQIRKRYGNDSVIRAAFLGGCIDHMSGGISREKRSVDYEKLKTE